MRSSRAFSTRSTSTIGTSCAGEPRWSWPAASIRRSPARKSTAPMAPMRWKRRRSPDMRRQALQQPVEETTGAWEDAYPSRVEPKPQWLPRLDPVVYGSIEQPEGPLTRRPLEDYRRDGFLFFPGLFGATEVAALGAAMARLGSDPVALDRDGSITEPGSGELRTLFQIHKPSAVFVGLARDPGLAGVARGSEEGGRGTEWGRTREAGWGP